MATAIELINGALRLIGVLAEGENPSPESAQDALSALNQLLDSWSAAGIACHAVQVQTIPWPANTQTLSVGPTGDFVGNRPVSIRPATYYTDNGIDHTLELIDEATFKSVSMKDLQGSSPDYLYANYTLPNVELTLYPIPASSITLHLSSVEELSQVAALHSSVTIPPGYLRALRYNLATELAAEFGVEPSLHVQKNAWQSKRFIKKANHKNTHSGIMQLPAVLRRSSSNIYEG
jgi:hypothetical protein